MAKQNDNTSDSGAAAVSVEKLQAELAQLREANLKLQVTAEQAKKDADKAAAEAAEAKDLADRAMAESRAAVFADKGRKVKITVGDRERTITVSGKLSDAEAINEAWAIWCDAHKFYPNPKGCGRKVELEKLDVVATTG